MISTTLTTPATSAADANEPRLLGLRELRSRFFFHAARVGAVAVVVVAAFCAVSVYLAERGVRDCADDGEHEVCVQKLWYPFTVQLRSETWTEDGVPDGPRVEWHRTGAVWVQGAYDHGVRTGRWVEGWDSGAPRFDGTYVNDRLEGQETWFFTDGSVEWTANVVGGRREGVERWYWPNGSLRREGTWSDGEKQGVFRNYDDTGALLFATHYENGVRQD